MAGGSRTLKLSILADVDNLRKELSQGANEVEGFGSKVSKFGQMAGAAFAAAGVAAAAYAGKLLVDGVKSAIEDEKAQASLATTLKNVTGATNNQIASTEAYISKTSLLYGITDDELRPSLDRLIRSTKDVGEAQRLQALAMDISAGSGKSLEAVSNALAKAHDGNFTALTKLGVGLDAAQLKTMSFDQVTVALSSTFANQANVQAETFNGKLERLKIAFDEGKETVGAFVLDALTPLIDFIVKTVAPNIAAFSDSIGKNLNPAFQVLSDLFKNILVPIFTAWWKLVGDVIIPGLIKLFVPILNGIRDAFANISGALKDNEANLRPLYTAFEKFATLVANVVAPAIGNLLGGALRIVGGLVSALITGFGALAGAVNDVVSAITKMINLIKANPIVQSIGGAISGIFGGGKASGGSVSAGTTYLVGERGPELFTPNSSGSIIPNHALNGGGSTFNIVVNGAIDPISTARQIYDILQREATASGGFSAIGSSRLISA